MNKAIEAIFQPYKENGNGAITLTGRSTWDIDLDSEGNLQEIRALMTPYSFENYGMCHVKYSLAEEAGGFFSKACYSEKDRITIENDLKSVNIINSLDIWNGRHHSEWYVGFIVALRGVLTLSTKQEYLERKWEDGRKLRYLFHFEFSSHLIPCGQTILQFVASELIYMAAMANKIKNSGNYMIFSDVVDGKIDPIVTSVLPNVYLSFPNKHDKLNFIKALRLRYPNAELEVNLDDNQIANLSSYTQNKTLENLFNASDRTGNKISAQQVIENKVHDTQAFSEGTLTPLDVGRVRGANLVGESIKVPKTYLIEKVAPLLREASPFTPKFILLVGPPSTGKSDLAMLLAGASKIPAFAMSSPKRPLVGETERLSRWQWQLLKAMEPCIGFIDEITETMSTNRSRADLDAGTSAAVHGAFLENSSDESLAGRVVIIGATNRPYDIGRALLSRSIIVPVLSATKSEFPEIVAESARRLNPDAHVDPTDSTVVEAGNIFFDKSLMPRQITGALKHALIRYKTLTPGAILGAANDAMPMDRTTRESVIYCDLYAIHLCSSHSLLPWHENSDGYDYPDHIREIMHTNGEINQALLLESIERRKQYINV